MAGILLASLPMSRFLLILALAIFTFGLVASRDREAPEPDGGCATADCVVVAENTLPLPGTVRLTAAEACGDTGYMCSELNWADSLRLLRWPAEQGSLTVHVPAPIHEPADVARRLQRAAARGILAWSGYPFPIRIVERTSALDGEPDIVIRWSRSLDDSRLGQARVAWRGSAAGVDFQVTDFAIVTRHPFHQRVLTDHEVELTAAHEMGHALGLPHSDAERDVMFPENTASHLSARDFRTMEAVYRLANGALVVP